MDELVLSDKQRLFARLWAKLILQAFEMGYTVTLGETWRSDATAALNARTGLGISNSLHRLRLAGDLNLFKDGNYLRDSESYRPLGEWWKLQNPLCAWGGDFSKPDGNHFSVTHEGVR